MENKRDFAPVYIDCTITLPPSTGSGVIALSGSRSAEIQLAGVRDGVRLLPKNGRWILSPAADTRVLINGQPASGENALFDRDFIGIANYQFYFSKDTLTVIHCSAQGIRTSLQTMQPDEQTQGLEYPEFVRSARVMHRLTPALVEIQPPKPMQRNREESLAALVLPPMVMAALMLAVRGSMGNIGFALYSTLATGSSVALSVISRKRQKKKSQEDETSRLAGYREYLEQKRRQIMLLRKYEGETRRLIHRPLEASIESLKGFTFDLFDRAIGAPDFLHVTLGSGKLPSAIQPKVSVPEYTDAEDPLNAEIAELEAHTSSDADTPVSLPLLDAGAIGIHGPQDALYEIIKCIALDIALRHIDSEVRMFFVLRDEQEARTYDWARLLPHVRRAESSLLTIACDDESRAMHFEHLYAVMTAREERSRDQGGMEVWDEYIVVLVTDCDTVRTHPVSRFLEKSGPLGVAFVFVDEMRARLPRGCQYLVEHHAENNGGYLTDCADGKPVSAADNKGIWFEYRRVEDRRIMDIAARLAPIYVVEPSLESQMTKMVTLFQMLGISDAAQWDLERRWAMKSDQAPEGSDILKSMAVPVGVMKGNVPLLLNLHEKGHGPHGLVAGTTGSGKSELLLSLVMSLCAHFPPDDVGFLVIDFKGEGLVGQIRGLPHLLGAITNLDGGEVERSLRFIKAEIHQRMRRLKKSGAGVKDITSYTALRRAHPERSLPPMPHLVIIVDEFAELAADHHDFLQELNSASRIGRSLGLHLILATQKPAGIITPQIDSNSRFRLCLKVQSKEDSMDVIKTPIAAEIQEVGRAYLKVGNNERFELFQSAYSSAPLKENQATSFSIHELNPWGKRKLIYTNKETGGKAGSPQAAALEPARISVASVMQPAGLQDPDEIEDDEEDAPIEELSSEMKEQYQAMIRRIAQFCEQPGYCSQRMIVLPPLPKRLGWDRLESIPLPSAHLRVAAGLADDPDSQIQASYPLDFDTNIYIVGSPQMGKTALLKTILRALSRQYSPEEVAVYAIDMSKGLPRNRNQEGINFEDAGIIGGIVYPEEEARMQNLMFMLEQEVIERRALYEQKGVGNHRAYLESGERDLPYIVLMVDGYVALKEQHEQIVERLRSLAPDAESVGMCLIVTSTRVMELSGRTMGYFGKRIAMHCNNADEYGSLFGRCRTEPMETPGRGLVEWGKRILHVQMALPADGHTEGERNKQMIVDFQEDAAKHPGKKARAIPEVPQTLPLAAFRRDYSDTWPGEEYTIPVGLSHTSVQPFLLNLLEWNILPLVGRAHTTRTNFMRLVLANLLEKSVAGNRSDVYIVDEARGSLRRYGDSAEEYAADAESAGGFLAAMVDTLRARQLAMEAIETSFERAAWLKSQPLLVLASLHPGFPAELDKGDNKKLFQEFLDLCSYKAVLIVTMDNGAPIPAPGLYRAVQDRKRVLCFDAVKGGGLKLLNIPASITNRYSRPTQKGDMYPVIDDGIPCKVLTILMES